MENNCAGVCERKLSTGVYSSISSCGPHVPYSSQHSLYFGRYSIVHSIGHMWVHVTHSLTVILRLLSAQCHGTVCYGH